MTYYINVNPTNLKDFIQIVKSLKIIGVIDSFGPVGDIVKEGEPISIESILTILENFKRELEAGNSLTMEELKKQK